MRSLDNIIVENARIACRNFDGNRYKRGGERSFWLVIENPEAANHLQSLGWNVHIKPPREEGDQPFMYIPVAISYRYDKFAPKIYKVTSRGKESIYEEDVADIDNWELRDIFIEVRPRFWTDDDGNEKVKAYLKTMYVTIEEDPFAYRFQDN